MVIRGLENTCSMFELGKIDYYNDIRNKRSEKAFLERLVECTKRHNTVHLNGYSIRQLISNVIDLRIKKRLLRFGFVEVYNYVGNDYITYNISSPDYDKKATVCVMMLEVTDKLKKEYRTLFEISNNKKQLKTLSRLC